MNATTKSVEEKDDSVILIVSALIVALIALFITSGIHNFEWVIYLFYAVFIFMGEFLVSTFIFRKRKGILTTLLTIATGSTFGIVFVLTALLPFW